MATGFGSAGAATALNAMAGAYTWVQLHTATPGAAGTTAVAAETTRKQATFAATAAGAFTTTAQLQWTNVAGSEDYAFLSVWTAATVGTFGWSGTITANPVTAGDTFSVAIGDFDTSVTLAS